MKTYSDAHLKTFQTMNDSKELESEIEKLESQIENKPINDWQDEEKLYVLHLQLGALKERFKSIKMNS